MSTSYILKISLKLLSLKPVIPIFEIAFKNSSLEHWPELSKSKYLNAFNNTVSSLVCPLDFNASLFLNLYIFHYMTYIYLEIQELGLE